MLNVECSIPENSSFNIQTSTLLGLSGLRAQELAVAIDAGPVAVDEGHGIAADRAIRRRPLGKEREQIRELDIVFVHELLPLALFQLQLNRLFRTLPARHPDERQSPVDDGGGYRTNGMAIRQLLAVFRGDINFPIGKTVLYFELFPQALSRGAGTATGRDK